MGEAGEGQDTDGESHERRQPKEMICMAGTKTCLLYTSDAADERSSVDLGGRRIIKKKKRMNSGRERTTNREKERRTREWREI